MQGTGLQSPHIFWVPLSRPGKAQRRGGTCRDAQWQVHNAEQIQRWRQHFENVLYSLEIMITHDFSSEDAIELDIDTGPVTRGEVRKSISNLKNGKAAGIDDIQAVLIKASGETMVATLTELCNKVWD